MFISRIKVVLFLFFLFVLGACTEKPLPAENGPRNLDSLLVQFPDSLGLLLERGNIRFDNYEFNLAMNDAARAFRLDSNNLEARLLYAEVLNNRELRTVEEVSIAQFHYQRVLKKQAKNLKALVGLASTYCFQQDYDKGFQYINEALRINPKYRNAYVMKGSAYLQLGNIERAKSSYETAIQQDPKFFEAYFILGTMYQSENDPICIEYFTTAHDLQPNNPEIKYQLAFSRHTHGQKEGAVQLYRILATDSIEFYAVRGLFHLGHIKQFDDADIDSAMYFYRSALKTEPRHVESWHNMGLCYASKGDKTRALQSYGKALKYDPDFELSRTEADRLR